MASHHSAPSVEQKPYALITGASEGIGFEIALQLALRKTHSLILIARNKDKLQRSKEHIEDALSQVPDDGQKDSSANLEIISIPHDLSQPNAAIQLFEQTKAYNVAIAVINAGTALAGPWEKHDLASINQMNALNMTCLAELIFLFLPSLQIAASSYGRGHLPQGHAMAGLLTVSSIAGLMPVPSMAGYAATKAYVLSLSEAIHHEQLVQGSRLKVSCVLPGPTKSELWNKEGGNAASVLAPWSSPEDVAKAALYGLDRNAAVNIPGISNQLMSFGLRFAPRFLVRRIASIAMNQWPSLDDAKEKVKS